MASDGTDFTYSGDSNPTMDFAQGGFNYGSTTPINTASNAGFFNPAPVNAPTTSGFGYGSSSTPNAGFSYGSATPSSGGSTGFVNKAMDLLGGLGSSAWNSIKNNPIPALGLGLAGINALQGPQTPPAVGDLRKSTGQLLDYMKGRQTGVDQLTQGLTQKYQTGKIDPVDERRIAQWTMQQKAQIENYYSRAGMPDSTAKINALKDIDAQALALTDQARQGYLSEAFQGMNLQNQQTGQVAQIQQSLNQTIAQLQASGDAQAAQALQNLMYQTGLFAANSRNP